MSEPGAHIDATIETFRYKAREAREAAATLLTKAEVYEDAMYTLRGAVDKEKQRADQT